MIEFEDEESSGGAPAWMATFADLMSLLMCFFVLLLSFSEMDILKYKQIAGSMKDAFGVQSKLKVRDIPKGTSVIAREFSPGRTTPTQIATINQFTTETTRPSLQVGNPEAPRIDPRELDKLQMEILLEEKLKSLLDQTRADAEKLRGILKRELDEGKVDIETSGRSITVRIREKGSFPSASATLDPNFLPVIGSLREALRDIVGKIAIEGHTDNVPIATARFQSNWDLSASRALSVTHELLKDDELQEERFMIIGHADTQPAMPNTSSENRARNRRVELVIRQGLDEATSASIKDLRRENPSVLEALDLDVEDLLTTPAAEN